VTVETSFKLNTAYGVGEGSKQPVRWFMRSDGSQVETEVPNVKVIAIDSSLDTDAATCEITLSNQWMENNATMAARPPGESGFMGYFSFDRGGAPDARSRWGHQPNPWTNVLTPNALLRTYQGYGGNDLTIPAAQAAGNVVQTGTWLVDEVRIDSNGTLVLRCRNMAKLLIEQIVYPPLVPVTQYPVRYCRWIYPLETKNVVVATGQKGPRTLKYDATANSAWASGGVVEGHNPAEAFDGNLDSFWLSIGNDGPEQPYAVEWVQATCGDIIDTVTFTPWAGNYTCWVSVMENGAWVSEGGGNIPYNEAGVGRYNGAYEARIPYVIKAGVPWEAQTTIALPRAYQAQKVRFTFSDLARSPWGPYPYRAGLREATASLSKDTSVSKSVTEPTKENGNYLDFADIVKDFLLWAGFWLQNPANERRVYSNIEPTGSYSEDCFPVGAFDKKPVIDAINQVKEVVGYIFFVDADGGAHFESPNWWGPGNFYDDGQKTNFIPDIDERIQLTGYTVNFSDQDARSLIVITSDEPTLNLDGTITTIWLPNTADVLKGMLRPVMYAVPVTVNNKQQKEMAELVSLHIWFKMRQGQTTIAANPAIQINDQVRIFERTTAESYVHYVRGITSQFDADTGSYTQTLKTHWLGGPVQWALK